MSDFTEIPNEIINNTNLSGNARLVMCYLLSRGEDYNLNIADVRECCRLSLMKSRRAVRELMDAGYIIKEQTRGEAGGFGAPTYHVYQFPQEQNHADN